VTKDPQHRTWVSSLFVAALVIVSLTLAFLQFRWIGEVSQAERERLSAGLQTSLNRFGQDFDWELVTASAAIVPPGIAGTPEEREAIYSRRYQQWHRNGRRKELFRTISMAVPDDDQLLLKRLDLGNGQWRPLEWPQAWNRLRERLAGKLGERPAGGPATDDYLDLMEIPVFARVDPDGRRRESEWLIFEINIEYIRAHLIPELLQRHLGSTGTVQFDAEVVSAVDPSVRILNTAEEEIRDRADASVRFFDPYREPLQRRFGPGRGPGPPGIGALRRRPPRAGGPPPGQRRPGGPDRFAPPGRGRWILFVRHQAGSLETAVERGRQRNLAVTSALVALLILALIALIRYTRRAQRLADLQMQFVAGVSHELRTPLSVMRTAGHNLRQGRVALDPARIEKYGALIEDESEKLTAIVDQVLRFANVKAGRVIGSREPLSIETVIDEALNSTRREIAESGSTVEQNIEPQLPLVSGEHTSLVHALQNLVNNAAKYGNGGGHIGISAKKASDRKYVEVRIGDRGRGLSPSEAERIFDPFYRGAWAVQRQIHGTGLGLTLVRTIIEAHGGTVTVASEEGKGTEFLVRLPAVASEDEHEFKHSAD
jgi:signal transduction histidine kinase